MFDKVAEFYRAQTTAEELIRQQDAHADDGTGRCRCCKAGNHSSGAMLFPCTIRQAITQALRPTLE